MPSRPAFRFAGLVALLPLTLSAQSSWTGSVDNDWTEPGNWSPSAPGSGDDALIDTGHAFVSAPGIEVNRLVVGESGGSSGELTLQAGGGLSVSTESILGYDVGSEGVVTVTGVGSTWSTGALVVGTFGGGSLSVLDGALVVSASVDLASGNAGGAGATSGEVLVSGAGSRWEVAGAFAVGAYADETTYNHAELTVADGGAVAVGGGAGTLQIHNNGLVRVGVGGAAGVLEAGEIALEDTGELDPDTQPSAVAATLAFDHSDDIAFAALISGGGRLTKAGAGTLTLTGNGAADLSSAETFSGLTEVSDGTLVLDVAGYWDGAGDFAVGGPGAVLRVAAGTTLANDIFASAGGTVEVAGALEYGFSGSHFTDATLRVLDGGAIIDGDVVLEGTSVLVLEGADAVQGGFFTLESGATLQANATGAVRDADLDLNAGAVLSLGADEALDNTFVAMGAAGMVLNGHDVTLVGLAAMGGTITNDAVDAATFTVDSCGCDGLSYFFGLFSDGAEGSGALGLTVTGAGALLANGTLSHTGPTVVDGAVLLIIGDPSGEVASPVAITSSAVTVQNGGTFGGNGTAQSVTVLDGGTLDPGDLFLAPVGTLTTGSVSFTGDTSLAIMLYDAAGTAGTGWDFLQVNGDLIFDSDPLASFTVLLSSIGDVDEFALNFDSAEAQSWKLTSVTGDILNFPAPNVFVDASLFLNASGEWSLVQDGQDLVLHYTPVAIPEPATAALLGAWGAAAALGLRRRRCSRRSRPHAFQSASRMA